jgi:hypothetical protein
LPIVAAGVVVIRLLHRDQNRRMLRCGMTSRELREHTVKTMTVVQSFEACLIVFKTRIS